MSVSFWKHFYRVTFFLSDLPEAEKTILYLIKEKILKYIDNSFDSRKYNILNSLKKDFEDTPSKYYKIFKK